MRKKGKSKVTVAILLVALICVAVILESGYRFFSILSVHRPFALIPGFEGAKCQLDGVRQLGWPSWQHYNEYVPARSAAMIAEHEAYGYWNKVYFVNSDPFNQLIAWDYKSAVNPTVDRIQVLVETQNLIQLQNLNYMGDPLDWNKTQQLEVIQYQPNVDRALNRAVQGNEVRYTLTKRSILLVPAEIHISLSIPATQGQSFHLSGWQEGTWPNLELWFKLDFTVWNTLAGPYASTDALSEWEASYFQTNPASEYNTGSYYDLKGGFPVAGWVQGYLENVGSDWPEDFDDEIWSLYKSNTGYSHKLTEKSKAILDASTQTLPALLGRSISLFTNATDPYVAYEGGFVGFLQILEQARTYPWAQAQVPTYFPITVQTLGTVTEGGVLGPWDIYYPAVNYRIRVIYAVYGQFTYLWTVQTAEDNGYPGWQTREYEWVHAPGLLDWLWQLFGNPLFLFFLFCFVILLILVILAIFAPGILRGAGKLTEHQVDSYLDRKRRKR